MFRTILILATLLSARLSHSGEIPLADFARDEEYINAVLSPKGEYIAIERAADDGKTLVAVMRTKDMELVSHIGATTHVSPINPVWVSDDEIVVQFTEASGSREHDWANGELMTMDVESGRKTHIVEHQQFVTKGKNRRLNNLHGFAEVVHTLPGKDDHILIQLEEFKFTRTGIMPKLYRIHTKRGTIKHLADAPSYQGYFSISVKGEPRYSFGIDKNSVGDKNKYVVHKYVDKKWRLLKDIKLDAESLKVVAETEDPSKVILRAEMSEGTDRLYRYNMDTGESELLFVHAKVDPGALDIDPKTNRLIAVHFEAGYPDLHIVDENHLYAKWYPALFQYFDGNRVRITSASNDGEQLMVHVTGAREPGQFHLFNTKTKAMKYLFNARQWINPAKLAETKPFSFKARDGLELQGYLTLPPAAKEKSPLVVMPHGGPHSRDWWRFNPDVQFLASRGYAVLQVNFRGSMGFGLAFMAAGYKKWGSDIQHDIIDATRWAVAKENINEKRVCIMGASFGGYSALMSPILEPDLYHCAIGFVGVYDQELMWKTGDIKTLRTGKNYLNLTLGENRERMKKFSPAHRADELAVPVFLAHGKADWRVDVKHFEAMKAALEKNEHPHETFLVKKEGHGFGSAENREEYYRRVELFLDKHIGR